MQDEARHVGYGMQHLKWVLDHFPERREIDPPPPRRGRELRLRRRLRHRGDGAVHHPRRQGHEEGEHRARASASPAPFQLKQSEEYFERLAKCGLPERRERSRLWKMVELDQAGRPAWPPDAVSMAYYAEKDFFDDERARSSSSPASSSGNLTLELVRRRRPRACRRGPPTRARGLTYDDCNLGPYGYDAIPELVRNRNSMAARGSVLVAEAPRPRLHDQPQERRLVGQRRRALRGGQGAPLGAGGRRRRGRELLAAQRPAPRGGHGAARARSSRRWRWSRWRRRRAGSSSINQEFLELKSFLCAQMIDEARHVEACRKRALVERPGARARQRRRRAGAQGAALRRDLSRRRRSATNLLLGSFVARRCTGRSPRSRDTRADRLLGDALACRTSRARSPTASGHVRYHLAHQPARTRRRSTSTSTAPSTRSLGIAGSPELLEPLVVLAAGSREPRGAGARQRLRPPMVRAGGRRVPRALRGRRPRRPARRGAACPALAAALAA